MRFCNNCGAAINEEGLNFCPGCGAKLQPQAAPATQNSMAAQPAQDTPATQPTAVAQPAPVVQDAAPAKEVPVAAVAAPSGLSMFWHETVSKKLMNVAAIVLIILGVLMWTGGIYQHVVFRFSDEGTVARIWLNAAQGGFSDAMEEPSGLIDDVSLKGMRVPAETISEMDKTGQQIADAIDDFDISFTSDYLYEQFGFMRFVDIVFGLLMIALGLFAYYIGQNLSQYKRDALQLFELYNIAVLGAVVLYGILYNFVLSPFSDIFEIFTLPYFVIIIGLVASFVFNKEYYAKRGHMFMN